MRQFSLGWFKGSYSRWLEYSVKKDAAFCLCCYLFKNDYVHGSTGDSFTKTGFKAWNKASERLDLHVGKVNSLHHKCFNKMLDLSNQSQSIQVAFDKQSEKQRNEHRIRLNASIDVVRFLLYFGLSFRGHDESDSSKNKGLFLGLLEWLAKRLPEVDRVILKHAPKNDMMTSPKIQKDIVSACAQETVKAIINDLDGDYFGILVDESKDISQHEQMALVLRYVDKKGQVNEPFIGLVRVHDTSAKSLKEAILSLLMKHSLSPSKIRGQGYDGAMVAKKHKEVETFFAIAANVLNVIGAPFKCRDQLRDHHAELLVQLLESGEVQSGKGLNQERGLQRPGDTRWGSHCKTLDNFVVLFASIVHVLGVIEYEGQEANDRLQAEAFLSKINSFEFVFLLHLMLKVLLMSNELSKALQKKEQDIVNAMIFLDLTKERLQEMRDEGWKSLMDELYLFCTKHDILVPNMEEFYIPGKSKCRPSSVTYSHHLRVELFYTVIDLQLQELNRRFDVVSSNLLLGMASLNPANSFANFDKERIMTLAKYYPDEFGELKLRDLSHQLDTFILHMQHGDPRFSNLKGISDLAKALVEANLVEIYSLVYLLVKLTLILPVATATVERAFSSMKYIKDELRSSIGDAFLNDCLVCYFEKEVFTNVSNDAIIDRFQSMKTCRVQV
uniref:Zinc finger MYM-type protein 1-like n=1 Tax=Nicotiana tabacum TaxID=4097 RepID=A0A1S3XWR9_TOBAC|nr:PREDICTED: zinc finger MYM-type protein 1-like [Nicotiana tabacum]